MSHAVIVALIALALAACGRGAAESLSTATAEVTRTSEELVAQTAATARAVAIDATVVRSTTATPPATVAILPGVARPGPTITPLPTNTPLPTSTPRPVAPPSPTQTLPPTASSTPGTVYRKDRAITYVAIGASDTVGLGASNPEKDGWVPQLYRRLPASSKLVNLGISGAKLSDALVRELPHALEAKPDLVTVWNVVNDLNANVDLAAYERDLDRLLGDLTGKTSARIVIGNCPDLARVPVYQKLGIPPEALRQEVGRWNAAIARVVGKYPNRVYLVDLYARSGEIDVDPGLVATDDFHPSAKGYARLADVFWDFMLADRLFPSQ